MNFFHPELNIGSECVLSILEDSSRRVWIGTDGDGIYRLNADREVDRHYTADKLPAGVVLTILRIAAAAFGWEPICTGCFCMTSAPTVSKA